MLGSQKKRSYLPFYVCSDKSFTVPSSKNKEWIYAGVYADEGITGTTDNRTEFQRMIEDCEKGKIDIILTKSISRFAHVYYRFTGNSKVSKRAWN